MEIRAASRASMTSVDSAASVTRSAIRRLVLARISGETTPPGRWVARIRWMPSDRPRWAMLTRPVTKSGSSATSEANSSMTMSSRGIGSRRSPAAARLRWSMGPVVLDVLGPDRAEQCSRRLQLGAERLQRPLGEVGVEVGDHADGVRQVDAVLERRAALVVDQHERHRVRPVADRERGDDRLQQLGLAGAGGAGDQAVRAVLLRSTTNVPVADAPIGAAVVRPPARQQLGDPVRRRAARGRARRAAAARSAARCRPRPG